MLQYNTSPQVGYNVGANADLNSRGIKVQPRPHQLYSLPERRGPSLSFSYMVEAEGPKCPQATAELLTHICQKGFQAGSLIGLGIVLPAVALRRRSSGASLMTKDFQTTGAKVMTYSAAIGLVTTGGYRASYSNCYQQLT